MKLWSIMQLCSICFLKDLDAEFGLNNENETQKINSIDWLIYDSSQRAEAMKQANAIIRGFLGTCVILFIGPTTLGEKGSYDFTTVNVSVCQ